MSHAFKFRVIVISAVLGMGGQAPAQCFLCSDGNQNTASGSYALYSNTTGTGNTAFGLEALYSNNSTADSTAPTGSYNTALGSQALYSNTTGYNNTASGHLALHSNTTGNDNLAMGFQALNLNTVGFRNSALGSYVLAANTTGTFNNAIGYASMAYNTTGNYNNAQGYLALENNTTGSNNIAIGQYAGYYLTTGNSNIDIGNEGVAGESSVIRIGSGATATYIAGINKSTITGAAVYVTSSGQLGVLASSERYKTDIAPIGAASNKLNDLRPVSFRLKSDPQGALQYGLIAEEVDKVYPELVIRDETGKIQGVRYDELAPMLLNEVKQQRAQMAAQDARLQAQEQKLAQLEQINQSMQAALTRLLAKDERVAMR